MSVVSMIAQLAMAREDVKQEKIKQAPKDVIRYPDLYYGKGGEAVAETDRKKRKWSLLDVYRPKEISGRLPVIVNVHGGGWVYGTKDTYLLYGMSLAQRGFAVVNFNYGLAPGYKFPTQLKAINDVVEWILAHGREYELDTDHIFMVGDSAGAHLLAIYASMCVNADCVERFGIAVPKGFVPTAVALNCGAYDMPSLVKAENKKVRSSMKSAMKDLLGKKDFEKKVEEVNALSYLTEDFPPAYVMSANEDFLQPQTLLLRDSLNALGVSFRFQIYGDENEKLQHVFHCDVNNPKAAACNDDECDFFRTFL